MFPIALRNCCNTCYHFYNTMMSFLLICYIVFEFWIMLLNKINYIHFFLNFFHRFFLRCELFSQPYRSYMYYCKCILILIFFCLCFIILTLRWVTLMSSFPFLRGEMLDADTGVPRVTWQFLDNSSCLNVIQPEICRNLLFYDI